MTRKSIEQLLVQTEAVFPDNDVGAIRPSDIRLMWRDMLDTFTPMYGGLLIGAPKAVALTATPKVLPFDTTLASFPPEWSVNAAAGTLSRSLAGVGAFTSRFTVTCDIAGSTNGDVTVCLYKNGAPLTWRSTLAMRGISAFVSCAFGAIDYSTVDAVYELRVSTNYNQTYNFANVNFVGQNIPVRTTNPDKIGEGLF